MPGCRYHKDSVHEQKQSGDQEQNHDKDLVSQMTSRSHLEWQFLPSVNIKQNFQVILDEQDYKFYLFVFILFILEIFALL